MRLGFGPGAFFLITQFPINTLMRYHELLEDSMYDLAKRRTEKEHAPIIKKAVALIKRDCQPYLSQVKDPMKLRRGVSRDMNAHETGRPLFNKKLAHLPDRIPRGSYMSKWHPVVNDYFTLEFGLPFRNSVITTGNQLQSSNFGTDVAVFPIGNFKFLWSPNVYDLNHVYVEWKINGSEQKLLNALKTANYQTTDLQTAIESNHEIMIWVEEYYTLDNQVDRDLVKKLLK